MALYKKILKDNGIETEYHKISSMSVKPKQEGVYNIIVGVNSYISKDIRDKSDMYYVDSNYYTFNISDVIFEIVPSFTQMYTELKKLPEFENAKDI